MWMSFLFCFAISEAPLLKTEVTLEAKSGSKVTGNLVFEELAAGGVSISGKIRGLKPGLHGFHIHETGDCSAKDAASAGGHFHLEGQVHGALGEKTAHQGDLGNLDVDRNGLVLVHLVAKGLTLKDGPNSIRGRSVIVHGGPDDLKSQPAGNSGPRVACGVIEKPKP